jgi:hypothetical protein
MSKNYTAQLFVAAIPGTGGIVSAIARKVECDWNTAKKYIDTYPTVRAAYDAECEAMLDLAESTVLKNIKDGDTSDAKWYLTKKGKGRGYGDAVELTGAKGGPIEIAQVPKLTDDQLERIAASSSDRIIGTSQSTPEPA